MEEIHHLMFSLEELDLFARASGDYNPLHISSTYSHSTPFGERVVHGAYVVLKSLPFLLKQDAFLKEIKVDFIQAILCKINYSLKITKKDKNSFAIQVKDGPTTVCKISLKFSKNFQKEKIRITSSIQKKQAEKLSWDDCKDKKNIEGLFCFDWATVEKLLPVAELERRGVLPSHILSILGSSYVVGMKFPGEKALFQSFHFNFNESKKDISVTPEFKLTVNLCDQRFMRTQANISIFTTENILAEGKINTFFLPPSIDISKEDVEILENMNFEGKIGIICGASRGLGAALSKTLVAHGATVYGIYKSCTDKMQDLADSCPQRGSLIPIKGDLSDMSWCEKFANTLHKEGKTIDFIILAAAPQIKPIWLSPINLKRFNDFIFKSFELYSIPLTYFSTLLKKNNSSVLAISSQALSTRPPEWGHYLCAKRLIEQFIESVHLQNPDISYTIVRPPKVLTDQTNTVLARMDATSPMKVSIQIAKELQEKETKHVKITELVL